MADDVERRNGGKYPGDGEAQGLAQQIAASPGLRAKFFEDPKGTVAKVVPSKRLPGLGIDAEAKTLRAEVLSQVAGQLKDGERASSVHADMARRQFLVPAMRNPERTFQSILALSIATFGVGVALIAIGAVRGLNDTGMQNTVVASVFGGSGVFAVLGSVFNLVTGRIRLANANHAQIRVILASFATELGHLRAFELERLDEIEEVNGRIREAMQTAVDLIQNRVKVEPKLDKQMGILGLAATAKGDGARLAATGAGAHGGEPAPAGAPAEPGGDGARTGGEGPASEAVVPPEGGEDPNRSGGN